MRLGRILFIAITVISTLLGGCIGGYSDVDFAKGTLAGLAKGSIAVQHSIDWPVFKALGEDVGMNYAKYTTEQGKAYYRKAFIANFSMAFQAGGGKLEDFANWRLHSKDDKTTVVAADKRGTDKIAYFTIAKEGKRRLVSIQWGTRGNE